jgi:hypothetical protein
MSERTTNFCRVDAIDIAQAIHDVIMDLDADLFDSEHRHQPIAQALAAYRDRWIELAEGGTSQ